MKKDLQKSMNEFVISECNKMKESIPHGLSRGCQLRTCNAIVFQTSDYYILCSYETIVAFINKHTMQKFDILRYVYRYTATSAQHIAKFFQDYGDFRVSTYTYREV